MIHIQLLVTTTSVLVGSAFQPRPWSFYCSNAFDYAVPAAHPYACLTVAINDDKRGIQHNHTSASSLRRVSLGAKGGGRTRRGDGFIGTAGPLVLTRRNSSTQEKRPAYVYSQVRVIGDGWV
jgi:hypothetical protein